MSNKDKITDALFHLYDKEIDEQIIKEQEALFKNGTPKALEDEAWSMFQNVYKELNSETEECAKVTHIAFGQKESATTAVEFLEPFELLAAGGDDPAPWFAQRISANGDYIIEISPFDDNPDEAGIIITAVHGKEAKLQAWLDAYKGQSVPISLSWNNVTIFEAVLYFDEHLCRAEGDGKILRTERQESGTKLGFKVHKTDS